MWLGFNLQRCDDLLMLARPLALKVPCYLEIALSVGCQMFKYLSQWGHFGALPITLPPGSS